MGALFSCLQFERNNTAHLASVSKLSPHQGLHYELQSPAEGCTKYVVANSKAGRGTHVVFLWSRQIRAVISHCTSDMSQCPSEGDKTQTPQETNFSIKLSPSRVLGRNWLCVTVKLMIDDGETDSIEIMLQSEMFDLLYCKMCGP